MAVKKSKVEENTTKIRITEDRINDVDSLDISFIDGKKKKTNKEKILKEKKDYSFLYGILKTLVLFLVVAVLFVFAFMYARDNNLLENVFHIKPQIKVKVTEKRVKAMDYNYLFIGDYHTEGLEFSEFYKPYVKISNDDYRTSDILDDLRNYIYVYNPTNVFIELGSNDITDEESISTFINNLKRIIRGIQNNRSLAIIYVESLYPVNDTIEGYNGNLSVELIKKANTEIAAICKSLEIDYIDIYSELSENDLLKEDYTDDGIRLNEDGYKKVFKIVNRYIEDERD